LEISANGIFAVIAPFKEKRDGNNTYNWDQKETLFLSPDEIANLSAGAQEFNRIKFSGSEDVKGFNQFCMALFEKDNYKSLILVHDTSKTKSDKQQFFKYFGLEAYIKNNRPRLNFVVKTCSGTGTQRQTLKEIKFFFPSASLKRFEDFLKFLQIEGYRKNFN
jgi:hypothetical protein